MALFPKNTTASPPKGSRAALAETYQSGRHNLLLAAIFTALNTLFALLGAGTYFLFSASVPYYAALLGRQFYDWELGTGWLILGAVIAVVMIGAYVLLWAMTKHSHPWMDAAVVFFAVDCVGMIAAAIFLFEPDISLVMDVVFHAYVMYYLVTGNIAGHKLAKLPPEDAVQPQAEETTAELPSGEE